MSLLTKPTALLSTDRVTHTIINTLYDDLYDKIGQTIAGRGTMTWENLAASADIAATQVANTAAVLAGAGTQTFNKATSFASGMLKLIGIDASSTNRSAQTTIADAATTIAVADTAKLFQRYLYASTSASNAVIDTITDGTVGDVIGIFVYNDDAAQTVQFRHIANAADDAAGNANEIRFKDLADVTVAANTRRFLGLFVLGDLDGLGVNQWWQIT